MKEVVEDIPNSESNSRKHSRHFSIDGHNVILQFGTTEGPDTGVTLLFGAQLFYEGLEHAIVLAEHQCETSLVGRYLLFHRYFDWSGAALQLIDMTTEISVFGPLKYAVWINN